MLQALKLDSASHPAATREREAGTDLQDSAFAGYLSSAASSAASVAQRPSPAPAPTPRREASTHTEARRTGSSTERQGTEPRPTQARPPERAEEAQAKTPVQASEGPQKAEQAAAPEAAEPSDRPQTASAQAEPAPSESSSPPAAPTPAPAAPAAALPAASAPNPAAASPATATLAPALPAATAGTGWEEGVLPSVQGTQRQLPASETPGLRMSAMEAADPTQLTAARAQTGLEQALPGLHLRAQIPEEAPAATSRPALSELLSLPKPEVQIPKPLLSMGRAEGAGKELPPAPVQEASLQAPPALAATTTATAPVAQEAFLAVAPKTETATGKTSTTSSFSAASGVPAAAVKGTTPVPALESAQGAKANATFEQVDGSIRWLIKNHEKGAEIQLNPESLGRVVIKLRMEGGEVHARLWASEASTVPLLQDQKAALEASLRQQGLSLGSFDLQQGRRGDDPQFQSNAQAFGSGAGIAPSSAKKQDLPTVAPALPGGAHLIEVFA